MKTNGYILPLVIMLLHLTQNLFSQNLAIGSASTATGTYSGSPAYAIDSNNSTFWGTITVGANLTVTLPTSYPLSLINLSFYNRHMIGYNIDVLNTSGSWVNVATVTQNTLFSVSHAFSAIVGSKVRLTVTTAGGGGGSGGGGGVNNLLTGIYEIEIYSASDILAKEFTVLDVANFHSSATFEGVVNFNNRVNFNTVTAFSGNVGIGTSSPDEKLCVKGTIHTNEVKVDLLGAVAPDYVFENTYHLIPLKEIQQYITEKRHLPEVPSSREMEMNGVNLKEMNLILLKKVEELTLYLIDQNNLNVSQSRLIKRQQEEIDSLRTMIESLSSELKK